MSPFDPIDITRLETCDFYDELPLWSAPFGLLVLECVPVRLGVTILDIGAGTGFLSIELAQRCGPESRVIAVDPWAAAAARLRRKIEHLGIGNVRVLEQDAATLDLADASVDVVISNLGINNFENADAVLRTCHRVAKPGASLVLATNLSGHMDELYRVFRDTLIELGHRDRLPTLEAHVEHRGTVETITRRLTSAGFEIVDASTHVFPMRFADGTCLLRHHFIRLGFVAGWRSIARPRHEDQTFEALERRLNAAATKRGELYLTIPMACIQARKPPG